MSICTPSTINIPDNETFWDELTDDQRDLYSALGWTQLQALLGYSLAICPVTVRPCSPVFYERVWKTAPVASSGGLAPTMVGGAWLNCVCTASVCGCGAGVALPGPVGRIDEVKINDVVLAPEAYRVDDHALLVRQDGESWPTGQDFSVPAGNPMTWTVRYFRGDAPTEIDDWAAGILAIEFAKAGTGKGKGCRLPSGTQSVVRNGVSLELRNNLFLDGTTGIREIDMLIAQRNPHRLTQPSLVRSPDSRRARTTTWSH